jgi:hypothetical protein
MDGLGSFLHQFQNVFLWAGRVSSEILFYQLGNGDIMPCSIPLGLFRQSLINGYIQPAFHSSDFKDKYAHKSLKCALVEFLF